MARRKAARKKSSTPRAAAAIRFAGIEKALQQRVSQIRSEALGFVSSGRASLEKRIRGQLSAVAKKTTELRRRLESQISRGIKAAEARIGRTAERMLKELKLPTQAQIGALRAEIRAIRKRVDELSQAVEQLESSPLGRKAASSM